MKRTLAFITVISMIFASCGNGERQNDIEVKDDVITTEQADTEGGDMNATLAEGKKKSNIELTAIDNIIGIPGASLKVTSPKNGGIIPEGKLSVRYEVDGFTLGSKTSERLDYDVAESEKGQHIHAILNNEPYMAHYQPRFSKDLTEGQYLLLSFLSRSYHLSIKEESAYELIQFTVGDSERESYDLDQPFLFYSRPKGTYDIGENPDILLDFYLVNCKLSENGFRVMAKVAGHTFSIDEWKPFIIQGLKEGNHAITLTLVDGDGNTVNSPFNPVTRNIEIRDSAGNY